MMLQGQYLHVLRPWRFAFRTLGDINIELFRGYLRVEIENPEKHFLFSSREMALGHHFHLRKNIHSDVTSESLSSTLRISSAVANVHRKSIHQIMPAL